MAVMPPGTTELLARLVEIDSVNPALVPGGAGESAIAAFVAEWARAAGLEADILQATPGRPSVVVRARGRDTGRTLLLCGHTDTVNVEGMDAPFAAQDRGRPAVRTRRVRHEGGARRRADRLSRRGGARSCGRRRRRGRRRRGACERRRPGDPRGGAGRRGDRHRADRDGARRRAPRVRVVGGRGDRHVPHTAHGRTSASMRSSRRGLSSRRSADSTETSMRVATRSSAGRLSTLP